MTVTKVYNDMINELSSIKTAIKDEYLKAHMLKDSNFDDMDVISDIKMRLLEKIYPKVKNEVHLPKIRKILPF